MTAGSRVLQAQAPRPSAFSAHDWRWAEKENISKKNRVWQNLARNKKILMCSSKNRSSQTLAKFVNLLLIAFLWYCLSLGPYLLVMSVFNSYLPKSVSHISELVLFPHMLLVYYIKPYWSYGQWWLSWFGLRDWPGNHESFKKYMQSEYLEKMGFKFQCNENAP